MATISTKNPLVLASDFAKNYKQYESYLKHCLNILRTQNWLKDHQLDEGVSDYEYIREYINKNGISPTLLFSANKIFRKNVVSKIPEDKMHKVNTNRYYVDGLASAMNMLAEISRIPTNSLGDGTNAIARRPSPRSENSFTRLYHKALINGVQLEDREYSEDEIIDMIVSGSLMIVSSDTDRVSLTEQELIDGVNSGRIDFVNRDSSGGFVFEEDTGDSFDLFEAKNEEERKRWFAKNMLLLRYLRRNQMTFDRQSDSGIMLRCYKTFDVTYDHMETITQEVGRNFVRRKKKIPENYICLANKIMQERELEKKKFDNPSAIIDATTITSYESVE